MNQRLPTSLEIEQLTPRERLELLEAVWASLDALSEADVPSPDWHRAEIEKRLAALENGTSVGSPWPEVRARILRGS